MPQPSFRQRLRYRFDTFMAKGGSSIFVSLTLVFVTVFILLAVLRGLMLWTCGGLHIQHDAGVLRNAYVIFLQMTDPGNMVQDVHSSPWHKTTAIAAGMAGVVMLSALIAFITTALDRKIQDLRRGHSKVIEEDHTLILGWNEQRVVEIIRELVIANESEPDACVVVLAARDKEDMDDTLRLQVPDTRTTRLVTRSGPAASLPNLDTVSVETCKSVIILAGCDEGGSAACKAASDAKVIQTILAVTSMREDPEVPIVAEIFDPSHRRVVEKTFPGRVITVDTRDILAKILVQTSRSVGLSNVYNEILSFDGCEMYFHHADWGGITFAELGYRFPDGVPMGLRHGDGSLSLNPAPATVLKDDDDILIVAEDDSTIAFQSAPVATPAHHPLVDRRKDQQVEKELLLGWTKKAPIVLREYADYVMPGSRIDIMIKDPDDRQRAEIQALHGEIEGIDIHLVDGDQLATEDLLAVEPFHYDNIIILAESDDAVEAGNVDGENIITLLLLRDIFKAHPEEAASTKLITEVLDSQNHQLVARSGVKDVIISNRLISMILAQISESGDIKRVYDDIFEEDGSEIYFKPADLYFGAFPVEVSFADLMDIAQRRGEVCMGLKRIAQEADIDANCGITLIPEKNRRYTLGAKDCLLVLAEDES